MAVRAYQSLFFVPIPPIQATGFKPYVWDLQPPQPPQPKLLHRYGAEDIGDRGNEAPFAQWLNYGYQNEQPEGQPLLAPTPPVTKRAAGTMIGSEVKDIYIGLTLQAVKYGFENQQPEGVPLLKQRPYKSTAAAILPKDDGNEAPFVNWNNLGRDEDTQADLRHVRYYPPMVGTPDASDVYVSTFTPVPIQQVYWNPIDVRRPKPVLSALRQKVGWSYSPWYTPYAWEAPDSFHVNQKRWFKNPDKGDDGAYAPVIPSVPTVAQWGHEMLWQPRIFNQFQRGLAAMGKSQFAAFSIDSWVEPPTFYYPWKRRIPAEMRFETGIEAQANISPAFPTGWGHDYNDPLLKNKPRYFKLNVGSNDTQVLPISFPIPLNYFQAQDPFVLKRYIRVIADKIDGTGSVANQTISLVDGWQIQYADVPHLRTEKSGSIVIGDPGFMLPYISVIAFPVFGFEPVSHNSQKGGPRWRNPDVGESAGEFRFLPWNNFGWGLQDQQPPHPKPEGRFAGVAPREDGNERTFINWANIGYEPVLHNGRWYRLQRNPDFGTAGELSPTSQPVPPTLLPGEFFANMQLSSRTQFNRQRGAAISQPPPNAGDFPIGTITINKNFQRLYIGNMGKTITVEYV